MRPRSRKRKHVRRKCWVCGTTKRLIVFNVPGGEMVVCRDHMPKANTEKA
jgi:hypothetical protein